MRARKPFISEEERKQLDVDYAKAPCLLRDLWIIVRTLPALIQKDYA
jgi:lipopolysaccharide/colanic/teichoic acid biosynthesis glycosyltransferase